jgi:hypothetical protein
VACLGKHPRPITWGERMRRFFALLSVTILAVALAAPASAERAIHQTVDVNDFSGNLVTADGASMIRTDSGVSTQVRTTVGRQLFDLFAGPLGVDWEVGDATTNWFVVFNAPDKCSDGVCGENDVQDAALGADNGSQVGVHFATGHVAGSSNWRSAASLKEGDLSGVFFGFPLVDARTAEIHVVIRSHGPAANLVPGYLADAIGSIDAGCAINTCGDAQAAEFKPPTP